MDKKELFRKLPSVDEVLSKDEIKNTLNFYPRSIVLETIREVIELNRRKIINSDKYLDINIESIINNVIDKVKLKYSLSLKKVINGTGIVIHTNLGRSLVSEQIKDDLFSIATRYSNLEYDIENGERGSRYTHLTDIIKRLTGAEDVLVVNNNASAVLLSLNTLAKEKEVIVSRGELVEVGGSFRIPSIMEFSGAKLNEVGSTNKTHLKDYEESINENTGAIMKVHTSKLQNIRFY